LSFFKFCAPHANRLFILSKTLLRPVREDHKHVIRSLSFSTEEDPSLSQPYHFNYSFFFRDSSYLFPLSLRRILERSPFLLIIPSFEGKPYLMDPTLAFPVIFFATPTPSASARLAVASNLPRVAPRLYGRTFFFPSPLSQVMNCIWYTVHAVPQGVDGLWNITFY